MCSHTRTITLRFLNILPMVCGCYFILSVGQLLSTSTELCACLWRPASSLWLGLPLHPLFTPFLSFPFALKSCLHCHFITAVLLALSTLPHLFIFSSFSCLFLSISILDIVMVLLLWRDTLIIATLIKKKHLTDAACSQSPRSSLLASWWDMAVCRQTWC